jgi:hypothetical protein
MASIMGHNDYDDFDEPRPELPADAGEGTRSGYEPHGEWLQTAAPGLQQEAMRLWFVTRYWDPANDTPYNSQEGGYLYIHGGPYDAAEELYGRFGDQVPEEIIQAVVADVESDGVTEWAPIHTEPDYDAAFEFKTNARDEAYQFFKARLEEVDALLAGAIPDPLQPHLRQLLYSSLIAALEAFLADSVSYWVAVDKAVFRRFVTNCDEFKQQKLALTQIFERMETLEEEVEAYLQQLVWHRLDKVAPLMTDALGITLPPIGTLMKQILVRHDIVHRGGKTKEGNAVVIGNNQLSGLRDSVTTFVDAIETALRVRFPIDLSGLTGEDEF